RLERGPRLTVQDQSERDVLDADGVELLQLSDALVGRACDRGLDRLGNGLVGFLRVVLLLVLADGGKRPAETRVLDVARADPVPRGFTLPRVLREPDVSKGAEGWLVGGRPAGLHPPLLPNLRQRATSLERKGGGEEQ